MSTFLVKSLSSKLARRFCGVVQRSAFWGYGRCVRPLLRHCAWQSRLGLEKRRCRVRGCVVKNADGSQFLGQRVVSIIKFFQFQDIVSSDDHQQFLVWDAQHLVRNHWIKAAEKWKAEGLGSIGQSSFAFYGVKQEIIRILDIVILWQDYKG